MKVLSDFFFFFFFFFFFWGGGGCARKNRLCGAVLTSTRNLHVCFGVKIRKIGTSILLHTPVVLYKGKVLGVRFYTDVFTMKSQKRSACAASNVFAARVAW